MKKKYFISTAIPYVNGAPHIGHALEYVQTDAYARGLRITKGENNVFALTGTDENALKNVLAADKVKKNTRAYVDEQVEEFRKLYDYLDLSFDDFIRTTEDRHIKGAQKLWKALDPHDIYEDTYEGLYCVGCEEFKTEKDLIGGKCPEHNKAPEQVSEKNYFFRLSNYQQEIEECIVNGKLKICPEKRKNEVLGFIREGLKDFSISRSKKRARDWGIPVPGDSQQIIYVWLDALANYITALDYANEGQPYQDFWNNDEAERIHVIGKGIIKFHALYWVGLLLSAKLPIPTMEFAHGYVTVEGKKIGKSLGNAIHPREVVEKYGVDAFRYYLLKEIPADEDGDFSWSRMEEVYRADLQNGLGNLVARVAALVEKEKLEIRNSKLEISKDVLEALERYGFDEAMKIVWGKITQADQFVSNNRVWEQRGKEKESSLVKLVGDIRQIATDLQPFMPETAEKIAKQFGAAIIEKAAPLFPRLS